MKINESQEIHPLLKLCQKFALQNDEDAGKEAVRYVNSVAGQLPDSAALESLKLVLDQNPGKLPLSQDDIIAGLIRQSPAVRRYFAGQLQQSVTKFFEAIYDKGDGSANCLDTVVLDTSLWSSEEDRLRNEHDLFQLFVAKLMESGHDHDGRSLKGIARLLATDAEKLQHLVDEESFDAILSSLDHRLPIDVRSQATLATAKYLEISQQTGQKQFSDFVTSRVQKQRDEDFIIAFSAAAAVFPIVPSVTAALFLTEGFLQTLMPLLDRKLKNSKVQVAVLELLNAACIDRACREAISKYCSEWLSHIVSNGRDETPALAAVTLAKVKATENGTSASGSKIQDESNSVEELVVMFKNMMSEKTGTNMQNPIEGLAYASVKPAVKEQLARDQPFLQNLFKTLVENPEHTTLVFGGLTIILNLTNYLPNLSEEQKRISQLKAYANASKTSPSTDPLDNDQHVAIRCNAVVEAGVLPVLVESAKRSSASTRDLLSKILLSLSRGSRNRGVLAKQGAVKLLLSEKFMKAGESETSAQITQQAAHALARILISVNPAHVFSSSGFPQLTSAIRPLIALLSPSELDSVSDKPRDLLPVFESLLALTNLASSPDTGAAGSIVRLAWMTLEDLLLSNNTLIQRASCELVCNLMTTEQGVAKFADGSSRAGQRLHILLALADVVDLATRRAAGGALAMLTEYDVAAGAIIDRKRGVEILLGLCQDEEDEIIHRGIVCIRNLTCASGDIGVRGRRAVKDNGGVETLKGCLRRCSNPAILEVDVEALKPLVEG